MNEYLVSNDITRGIALALLVIVSVVGLFGFTMFVDLKPAHAFFGIDAAVQIAFTKVWETLKAVAQQFILKLATNFAVKLLQKLESAHIIKNMLHYSDALGFDQYIGNELNRTFMKPNTAAKAEELDKPEQTNLASIATEGDLFFQEMDVGQAAELGYESCEDDYSVDPPILCSGSAPAPIESCIANPNQPGCENPGAATPPIESCIANPNQPGCENPGAATPPKPKKGLTQEQQGVLNRAAVAKLTSQISCGGIDQNFLRKVSTFNAAKASGINPKNINPRSVDFYSQMAGFGNPYTLPAFQEMSLREQASQAESRGRSAAQLELTSSGLKSLRSEANQNKISRSSQTVAGFIEQSFSQALGTQTASSATGFIGQQIGRLLADILTNAFFQQKGRLVAENPYCGIIKQSASTFDYNANPPPPPPQGPNTTSLYINGDLTASVNPGDTVTLTWNVTSGSGGLTLTNAPSCSTSELVGFCNVQIDNDITFELYRGDDFIGAASAVLIRGQVGFADFKAVPNTITEGEETDLIWDIQGNRLRVFLEGEEVILSSYTSVAPIESTTYTMEVTDFDTGEVLQTLPVSVTVLPPPEEPTVEGARTSLLPRE